MGYWKVHGLGFTIDDDRAYYMSRLDKEIELKTEKGGATLYVISRKQIRYISREGE